MSKFADLFINRQSALMQLNKEVRELRELLIDSWDFDARIRRPALWRRVETYLVKTRKVTNENHI